MGVDISESYYFVGNVRGVKAWYDFLYPYSVNSLPEKDMCTNEIFTPSTKLSKLIEEKYPLDKAKTKKTHLGFCMRLGDVKKSGDLACFRCNLDNRNSISAYVFKELLEKYFHGVFMYYRYSGDSSMFNTYCLNDKEMRFFAYPPKGMFFLQHGWNKIDVLYDGNYTKEEIENSYRLFLGNTDINEKYIPVFCGEEALNDEQYPLEDLQVENAGIAEPSVEACRLFRDKPISELHGLKPEWQNVAQRSIDYGKYPELKGTPHVIGTRKHGSPYLYRLVAYDKTVKIPACITDFDEDAFDFDVLYDSGYDFSKEYGGNGYVLVLTDEQKAAFSEAMLREARFFFDTIKTESGEVIFDKAKEQTDWKTANTAVENDFPNDIPF